MSDDEPIECPICMEEAEHELHADTSWSISEMDVDRVCIDSASMHAVVYLHG